jgi:hypothetical protein
MRAKRDEQGFWGVMHLGGCVCSNARVCLVAADILMETFSIVREQFGVMLTIDLKPNGRNLEVSFRVHMSACLPACLSVCKVLRRRRRT